MKKLITFLLLLITVILKSNGQNSIPRFYHSFENNFSFENFVREGISEHLLRDYNHQEEKMFLPKKSFSQTKGTDWFEPDTIYYIRIPNPYDLNERSVLSYNNGNLSAHLQQYESWSEWEDHFIYLNSYDERNNLKESILQYFYSGFWEIVSRVTYSYDLNNNLLSSLYQPWNSGQWENRFQFSYTYDSQGNKRSQLIQSWYSDILFFASKEIYTYDSFNNLIEKLLLELDTCSASEQFENFSKSIYKYDEKNNRIEELYQRWYDDQWNNNTKYIYAYDNLNNMTSELRQSGNSEIDFWRYLYSYDEKNNRSESLFQRWKSEQWEDERRDTYAYDIHNNMTAHINQYWKTDNWSNNEKFTYSYDNNHNTTEAFYQRWFNDSWENSNSNYHDPFYINYNNKQSSLSWMNVHKIVASYLKTGTVSIKDNPTVESAVRIYPNPVSNLLNVETNNLSLTPEVNIYSTQGILLLHTKGNQIDVSSLPRGIYFVRISDRNGCSFGKFIKD